MARQEGKGREEKGWRRKNNVWDEKRRQELRREGKMREGKGMAGDTWKRNKKMEI